MASESARWAVYGAALGLIFFGVLIGWSLLSAQKYTDEQKIEINIGLAVNCSKCLEQENITCTPKELYYSQWGAICKDKYVPKNCTRTCKQI